MSLYRTFLAAVAAITLSSPVFADNTAAQTSPNTAIKPAAVTGQGVSAEAVKVNVNTAAAKELLKVKGLTAGKARAIVMYRKKHGEFKSLDDVTKVRSIGKLTPDEQKAVLNQLKLS